MPQKGTYKRSKPRIVVLRGYSPNEPHNKSKAVRVAAGVTIKSGQVITPVWNPTDSVYEWQLGWTTGLVPHIALQDSTDPNVLEAGTLVGLSSLGNYEIQTAYYKSADTFNDGVIICPDGTTGDVKVATAKDGVPIIGHVSRVHGPKNLGAGDYPADASATTETVIIFETAYDLNPA